MTFYNAKESSPTANPYNLNFERALLGNFLCCAEAGIKPASGFELVPPENYYLEEHRILARLIDNLVERGTSPCGPVLFDELLKSYPEPRAIELVAYFSSLSVGVARISPSWFYAGHINRLAGLRKIAKLREALANGQADRETLAELSEQLGEALRQLPSESATSWPVDGSSSQ